MPFGRVLNSRRNEQLFKSEMKIGVVFTLAAAGAGAAIAYEMAYHLANKADILS